VPALTSTSYPTETSFSSPAASPLAYALTQKEESAPSSSLTSLAVSLDVTSPSTLPLAPKYVKRATYLPSLFFNEFPHQIVVVSTYQDCDDYVIRYTVRNTIAPRPTCADIGNAAAASATASGPCACPQGQRGSCGRGIQTGPGPVIPSLAGSCAVPPALLHRGPGILASAGYGPGHHYGYGAYGYGYGYAHGCGNGASYPYGYAQSLTHPILHPNGGATSF
jgi:hypothetical protein